MKSDCVNRGDAMFEMDIYQTNQLKFCHQLSYHIKRHILSHALGLKLAMVGDGLHICTRFIK